MKGIRIVLITLVVLLVSVPAFAQSNGRLIANPADMAQIGAFVGKAVCVTITRDSHAPESIIKTCSTVKGATHWTIKGLADPGHIELEVEMTYKATPKSQIIGIFYFEGNSSTAPTWTAMIRFTEVDGNVFIRGIPIDEFRVF